MGIYIPREDVERASSIGLYDYFRMTMPSVLKRKGNDFCHIDHDSLCMKRSGEWWWHSRGLYGRNAISYLIIAEDMDFQTAVLTVLGATPAEYAPQAQTEIYENKIYEKELVLPEKDDNSDVVIKYLASRGIDEDVIQYFISEGSIYQDRKYKSVCFVGYDKDQIPRLVNVRGTRGDFKQNVAGSDRKYGFMNQRGGSSVHLFEAPIDMLSYATLINEAGRDFRTFNMLSMSGITGTRREDGSVKLPACLEQYFKDYPGNKAVYIHFDNDAAGINAGLNIKEPLEKRGMKVYLQYPPQGIKDVNEYLQLKKSGRIHEVDSSRIREPVASEHAISM